MDHEMTRNAVLRVLSLDVLCTEKSRNRLTQFSLDFPRATLDVADRVGKIQSCKIEPGVWRSDQPVYLKLHGLWYINARPREKGCE